MTTIGELVIAFLTAGIGAILFWMVRGGFRDMDRRFEQVDRRFEQVDRRFEQVDTRFDRVESRLDHLSARVDSLEGRIHEVRADITGLATRLIGPREAEGG